jgi:hypothetical protein
MTKNNDETYILYEGEMVLVEQAANGMIVKVGLELNFGKAPRMTFIAENKDRLHFVMGRLLTEDGWVSDSLAFDNDDDDDPEDDDNDDDDDC